MLASGGRHYDAGMTDARARRRAQARRDVAAVALGLFAERGYDEVTVAEIAEAADISRRTFFTYFASKEEAALVGFADDLEPLRTALEVKDPATPFVEVFRSHAPRLGEWHRSHRAELRRRRRLEREHPELAARAAGARQAAERELVTPHIAHELGLPPDHETVALVAGAFAGLGEVLMLRLPGLGAEESAALGEQALQLFEGLMSTAAGARFLRE